jgi:hypothetical protein
MMFETAVMNERTGPPWGFISGLLAFAVLLTGGAWIILL